MPNLNNKAVLILLPVWNEAKHLDQIISVIRRQTHDNFMLAIQDNKSEDETLEIARHHESLDNRIKVFTNEVHVTGGENWISIIAKIHDIDRYHYCCFQAGDDKWGDENYLHNLVHLLNDNPNISAANPTFKIVNAQDKVIKTIVINLDSKFAAIRVWRLCRNWDNVHQIYGLYRTETFKNLLDSKVSMFTDYSGSDWWWTYEFINQRMSLTSRDAVYYKLLDEPTDNNIITSNRGRVLSYFYALLNTCKFTALHLARTRQVRARFYLIAIPLFYFIISTLIDLLKMHFGIVRRKFMSKSWVRS